MQDIEYCDSLSVNAVGLLLKDFKDSENTYTDSLSISDAVQLVSEIPKRMLSFLLIHGKIVEDIVNVCERIKPNVIQIQSNIGPKDVLQIKEQLPWLQIFKTIHVKADKQAKDHFDILNEYLGTKALRGFVLDSARGGSGETHNWNISKRIIENFPDVEFLLAGGLTSENVAEAIGLVLPFGVDVMSSVNSELRSKKDHAKICQFMLSVRQLNDVSKKKT